MTQPLPFGDILKLLFEHRTRPDGTAYKAIEVARATGISPAQLSLLVSGQQRNTSIDFARAILRFFDVPIQILEATSEQQVIDAIATRQPKTEAAIRLRSALGSELSPRALRQIGQLVEYVLEREHAARQGLPLPPVPKLGEDSPD